MTPMKSVLMDPAEVTVRDLASVLYCALEQIQSERT